MNYPGNPSLPTAVKERVLSTFEQTLILYRGGRLDEVTSGCNLILQMDPSFQPARQLLDKSRNPDLPIDVDHLITHEEVPEVRQAREAMAAGDYERVIQLASQVLSTDLFNEDARGLAEQARRKLDAQTKSPAPSFVVEEQQPAGGRAAAPAADFGFAFEEDAPAAVSFDAFSFDSPAGGTDQGLGGFSFGTPAGEEPDPSARKTYGGTAVKTPTGEFDFATASVEMSDEDQQKIRQYLADGERAFEAGDYHQAIDLWSRIFLIDVTNEEASQRIEEAKKRRREIDQKIEPLLASGLEAFERGDTSTAHDDLTEVLRLDPHNATAQAQLDRLGEIVPGDIPLGTQSGTSRSAATPTIERSLLDEMPPPPVEAPAAPPPRPAAKPAAVETPRKAARLPSLGVIAAVVGVLLLAVVAWFVIPRMRGSSGAETAATEALFGRATMLANSGKFDQAIALLQDIKPSDPNHDKALVMIADLQQKKAGSAQMIGGVPAAQYYDQQLAAGRSAFAEYDYSRARAAFEQAMRVKPLPADAKEEYDLSTAQSAKLGAATALFVERKYEDAIASLQPILEQDPQNRSVRRMIADAHFNLGATALQEERTLDAVRQFDAVLRETPNDELARRSRELALRYDGQPKDLLYRIYVRYLPLRKAQ